MRGVKTNQGLRSKSPLSPQTIRIQHRLAEWTKSGRKHWDLYRWLISPIILCDAARAVVRNGGVAGIDGATCEDIKGKEWEYVVELSAALRSGTTSCLHSEKGWKETATWDTDDKRQNNTKSDGAPA